MEKITYLGQTIVRWQVGASTFLALPEKGARLMNWNVTLGDGSVRDVIYWPELTSLDDFFRIRGGNPILSPLKRGMTVRHASIFTNALECVAAMVEALKGPESLPNGPNQLDRPVSLRCPPIVLSGTTGDSGARHVPAWTG